MSDAVSGKDPSPRILQQQGMPQVQSGQLDLSTSNTSEDQSFMAEVAASTSMPTIARRPDDAHDIVPAVSPGMKPAVGRYGDVPGRLPRRMPRQGASNRAEGAIQRSRSAGNMSALRAHHHPQFSAQGMLNDILLAHTQVEVQAQQPLNIEEAAELKRALSMLSRKMEHARHRVTLEQRIRNATITLRNTQQRALYPGHSQLQSPADASFGVASAGDRSSASMTSESMRDTAQANHQVLIATERADAMSKEYVKLLQEAHDMEVRLLGHHAAVLRDRVTQQSRIHKGPGEDPARARADVLANAFMREKAAHSAAVQHAEMLQMRISELENGAENGTEKDAAPSRLGTPKALPGLPGRRELPHVPGPDDSLQQRYNELLAKYNALEAQQIQSREAPSTDTDIVHSPPAAFNDVDDTRRAELDKLNNEAASLRENIGNLYERNSALEDELEKLRERNHALESTLDKLNGEFELLQQNHDGLRGEHEGLRDVHLSLVDEHRALQSARDDLQTEHTSQRSAHTDLEEKLREAEEQHSLLGGQKSDLDKERESLVTQLSTLREENEALQAQLADHLSWRVAVEEQLNKHANARFAYEEQIHTLEEARAAAEAEAKKHSDTLSETKNEIETHRIAREDLERQLQECGNIHGDLDKQLQEHVTTRGNLEKLLEEHATTRGDLERQLQEHVTARAALEPQFREHADARAELEEQVRSHADARSLLEQQLRALLDGRDEHQDHMLGQPRGTSNADSSTRGPFSDRPAYEHDLEAHAAARASLEEQLTDQARAKSALETKLQEESNARAALEQQLRECENSPAGTFAGPEQHRELPAIPPELPRRPAGNKEPSQMRSISTPVRKTFAERIEDAFHRTEPNVAQLREELEQANREKAELNERFQELEQRYAIVAAELEEAREHRRNVYGPLADESERLKTRHSDLTMEFERLSSEKIALEERLREADNSARGADTSQLEAQLAAANEEKMRFAMRLDEVVQRFRNMSGELRVAQERSITPERESEIQRLESRARYLESQLDVQRRAAEQSRRAHEDLSSQRSVDSDERQQLQEATRLWNTECNAICERLQKQDAFCARVLGKADGREEMDGLLNQIKATYSRRQPIAERSREAVVELQRLVSQVEEHISDMAEELARHGVSKLGGNVIAQLEERIETLQLELDERNSTPAQQTEDVGGSNAVEEQLHVCVFGVALLAALLPDSGALAHSMSVPLNDLHSAFSAPNDGIVTAAVLDPPQAAAFTEALACLDSVDAANTRAIGESYVKRVAALIERYDLGSGPAIQQLFTHAFSHLATALDAGDALSVRAIALQNAVEQLAGPGALDNY